LVSSVETNLKYLLEYIIKQMGDYSYVFQGASSSSPFSPQPSQRVCNGCSLRNTSVVETNYFNKRQPTRQEPYREDVRPVNPVDAYESKEFFREDRPVAIPIDSYQQVIAPPKEFFREDRQVVIPMDSYQQVIAPPKEFFREDRQVVIPMDSYQHVIQPKKYEPYREEVKDVLQADSYYQVYQPIHQQEQPNKSYQTYGQRESFSEQIDEKKLNQVFTKLRKLSVPKLLETVEPILSDDLMAKARNVKGVLKDLIPTFTNEQLLQHVHMLPKETILKLQELNVPDDAPNAFQWTFQEEKLRDGSFLFVDELKNIPKVDSHFSLIDPMFAIGDIDSSYYPFDVIVNLAYPTNGVKSHEINVSFLPQTKQLFIKVGIYDLPGEPMTDLLRTLVPYLLKVVETHRGRVRILFHCHAGISRSSTVAIAFYSKLKGYTVDTSLQFIKSKRPIIQPNDGFMLALYQN
jgi:protein-tyrosine phosphatase